MKTTRKWLVRFLVILVTAAVLLGGLNYVSNVQNSLWDKAVTDILEVTAQGCHALDTYIEKDMEMLNLLAAELAQEDSSEGAAIQERIMLTDAAESEYICVDLKNGIVYTDLLKAGHPLEAKQLQIFQALQGRGVRAPFLEGRTGVWTTGCYQRFFFADGVEGYVQKTQPLSQIAERFSLSFYNDAGFSYVVNRAGDILIRSQHRNSNRTFQNLFDVIDLQGNDAREVDSFRQALEGGKRGVARFRYQNEDYVFCYVPMQNAEDWYVVSIVPNRVIMDQADDIVQHSQILFLLIFVGVMVLAAFFVIYRDSTRRVLRAEEAARKAAESANRSKSQFLSNMSHDIRTPMNAIVGMTKLASDHLNEPEKIKEYLKHISLSGQLLVGLINDILDMSKIESGKMALNNDTASLAKLMTDLVSIVQPTVAQKEQRFDIRLHRVEHEMLCFDALRLNQVLLNLLSNALKFTPEGGAISVDVTEGPSARAGCAHFTFRVTETGIGMKPEFMDQLFPSFTREQDSRVNKIEGSGLGMAITKMIVEMMEGSISVESEPGKGTTFTVDLDLHLAGDTSQERLSLPDMRVLVADDDASTCRSAEGFLRELGVRAEVTQSGGAAVDLALAAHERGEDYDLILLDWKMPGVSGLQAVRAIRERTGIQTPVLIFSAYDWAQIEAEALDAGVNGFIQKPFFKSTLYHCIRRYVLREETVEELQTDRVDLTGRRILLAEDNALNQEIAREVLEATGARVEIVDDGLSCVRTFERSAPGFFDLILMDVHMPIMDGYEATRRIRGMKRPDAARIPIFAMTADAFAEDIEAAKRAGMDSHLAKPLDIPAMMREIQRHLRPR